MQLYYLNIHFGPDKNNDDENLVVYMQLMEGSKKAKVKYNYHALYTNIIFNYIKHKTGDEFEKFSSKKELDSGSKTTCPFYSKF